MIKKTLRYEKSISFEDENPLDIFHRNSNVSLNIKHLIFILILKICTSTRSFDLPCFRNQFSDRFDNCIFSMTRGYHLTLSVFKSRGITIDFRDENSRRGGSIEGRFIFVDRG